MKQRKLYRLPVVRGVVALYESLKIGMKALGISANAQLEEPDEEISGKTWGFTIFLSLAFAIGLFFVLPVTVASFWKDELGSSVTFVIVEKLIRISIFLLYLWAISHIKDLRRVFEYHGAEHKVISYYEAGEPLTPENAQKYSRLHVRCGTSFLLIVMIIAVFVFAPIGRPALYWLILSRIVGIALVAGLAYEVIRWAGRNRRKRVGAHPDVAGPAAPEADHSGAVARPARGLHRGARGGARGRGPVQVERGGSPRHGSRGLTSLGTMAAAPTVIERLVEQVEERYRELEQQLADPDVMADRARYADVARSHRELGNAHELAKRYRMAESNAAGAEELLAEGEKEMQEELVSARAELEEIAEQLRLAMVERDPADDKNVIVEIRGGAGGDEAALFAGDLYRMLTRYAERRGFKTEELGHSDSPAGGFKEVTFAIKGDSAYSVFKYEAGVHRVQRVPQTESQGRIHTSTATVAVLPEAEDVEVAIDQNDLQIDVYRSSGPGGQSVNTTDSAVRITHKPTGLVVSMQDEKSQLQNRERAMRVLRARLYEHALREQQQELAADRRAQVGSGERSEKVRTYNYPQGRVTDHRIKLTAHNLEGVLEGELDQFTDGLSADERRRKLEAQAA